MSSLSLGKETLETIVSWAEIFTFAFTFIGAFSGVAYLAFNKPLKRIEAAEKRQSEVALAELKAKNLELERALAPRILAVKGSEGHFNIDELKGFSGTEVEVTSVRDMEARRAAASLEGVLNWLGWKVTTLPPSDDLSIADGVTVERYIKPDPANGDELREMNDGLKLQGKLLKFLKENGWDNAAPGVVMNGKTPATGSWRAFRIVVGFKPPPYSLSK
jgi:hypothetical protein